MLDRADIPRGFQGRCIHRADCAPRPLAKLRPAAWCMLLLINMAAPQTRANADASAQGLGIAGGAKVTWAWRRVPEDATKHRLIVAFARAADNEPRFFLLPMHPTSGEVRLAVTRGEYLHVFFRDGAHYRMRPPTEPLRTGTTTRNDFPELQLPDQRVPLRICGDASGEALFAIVPQSTAEKLIEPPPADADSNATPTPTPTPSPDFSSARHALAHYEPGSWKALAPMPADFDAHTAVWMVGSTGLPHVLYADGNHPERLTHLRFRENAWSNAGDLANVIPSRVVAVLAAGESIVALIHDAPDDAKRAALRPHVWKQGRWTAGEPLRLDDADLRVRVDACAADRIGDDLLVIWPDATAQTPEQQSPELRAARWPVEGGAALSQPVGVGVLATLPASEDEARLRYLLSLAAIAVILVLIIRGRRDSFIHDLPVPDGYVLARFGPRFIAFVLDLVLISLVAVPILFVPWMAEHGVKLDESLSQRLHLATLQDPDGVFWRWLIGVGVYALYGIAFESTLGGTPGKLVMRLRVCSHLAGRASFGAIVVRNLLRFEIFPFHFSPLVVLLVITRNRQRLGDLAANTLVVEKA